ncbi:MAG: LysE family translocator, partial [Rhizobiales bacterium]|nr:LysE family translocator [Hyphomicrobiales bacterium]
MPIEWSDLIIFTAAALALNLTPGNDMMFVLGQAIKGGTRAGIAASLGIATGLLVHLALVAAGVAVILAEHPAVFDAIRYAGAAYLVWLAIKILRQPQAAFDANATRRGSFAAWRDGVLVNVFNPKIVVFMFALLPPFIRPENGMPLLQLFILGMIFNVGGTLINFAVAIFSGKLASRIARDVKAARWFARASAALFVILAIRIAFERICLAKGTANYLAGNRHFELFDATRKSVECNPGVH